MDDNQGHDVIGLVNVHYGKHLRRNTETEPIPKICHHRSLQNRRIKQQLNTDE